MQLLSDNWMKYKPAMLHLPVDRPLDKADLMVDSFLMERHDKLEMYYAPHNEYVNRSAKVVIVGITPGWTQMREAFQTAREGLRQDLPDVEICRMTKEAAGFAGPMRRHLIQMLQELELHHYLGIASSSELFHEQRQLLHTTSLLRYPVFVAKKNYTGAVPVLASSPLLREPALSFIQEELTMIGRPFLIPLGKTVESILRLLVQAGQLDSERCLWGFPHPSGANGHRHKQFSDNYDNMAQLLKRAFE